MQVISLLSKLLFLFPLILWGFDKLYDLNENDFEIIRTKNSYKLILKDQKYINYKESSGFKFFLPYFTKEFNLKILRYNSIGYINGLISMDRSFSKVLNISPSELKYYLTDYSQKDQKELDYLLKGYSIPYKMQTSLSIEAYNIPRKVYTRLNKFIYFKKIPLKENKLQYILYSFYIVLDKKPLDKYIKTNYPSSKDYIKTFLKNIGKINLSAQKKKKSLKKTQKKQAKKKKTPPFRLVLNRIHIMKEYGYQYTPIKADLKGIEKFKKDIISKLEKTKEKLETLNQTILIKPQDEIENITEYIDELTDDINYASLKLELEKCTFNPEKIKKECFKNPQYFQNYIYFSIKKDTLPQNETILAYGDYKTFNDVGKYFYEKGDLQKAEIYLKKAYILAPEKTIPAHNLSVLYATRSDIYDSKKIIKYLKESNLSVDYYNLGVYYYLGLGVKESDKKAREYFEKAQEIPYAKYNLNIMKKYKIGIK